jgi:hypothetical protein
MSPKRPRGVKYEEAIGKTVTSFEVFGPQDMDQWTSRKSRIFWKMAMQI